MTRVLEVLGDDAAVAAYGAEVVAEAARRSVAERGSFSFAVSGGRTPWAMFQALADLDVPWEGVGVWQVDERVAPDGDRDRNLTSLAPLIPDAATVHPMPVTAPDLEAAAADYAVSLPPILDLVHLGMGDDGHTASLVPGDPVLRISDRDVAVTEVYRSRRRMTLTYPSLNRARRVLWLVTGADKAAMLPRLLRGDASIPAGGVRAAEQLVVADASAAASAR